LTVAALLKKNKPKATNETPKPNKNPHPSKTQQNKTHYKNCSRLSSFSLSSSKKAKGFETTLRQKCFGETLNNNAMCQYSTLQNITTYKAQQNFHTTFNLPSFK